MSEHTSAVKFVATDGEEVVVTGWREPAYDKARFSVSHGGAVITTNTDWPTAWKILLRCGCRDPQGVLRSALP